MISRFGEENVDWSQKPEVLATLHNNYVDMGVFPKITFANLGTNTWSSPNNKIWLGVNNRYFALEYNGGNGNPNYVAGLATSNLNGEHYQWYLDKHPAHILPTLKYSPEDAITLSGPIADVNDYVKQSIAEFIVGTRDINNDAVWNVYIRELNRMGLPQWLNIAQTTYNRQKR
jgi:putative aldouronate transport system substrate-binding protein